MIYLDYVSTTPLRAEVEKTYDDVLHKYFANSESLHDLGRDVSVLVEKSRHQIATLFHVLDQEVIFTSGASESNNIALKSVAWALKEKGNHIITSSYEHSSTDGAAHQLHDVFGFDVTYLQPNEKGVITLEEVKKALRPDTILVSLMKVNNEIGAVNPVEEIGEYLKRNSQAIFHVDAVQALGKLPLDLKNIDLMSLSLHKVFGMKGSGILIKKQYVPIVPLISGGQQEFNIRGGTINFATDIVAAKTIRLAMDEQKEHYETVAKLRDYLFDALEQIDGVILNSTREGSPFIVNFSYPKIKSEVMMNAFNVEGFALSAQSTCHSKSKSISHVYSAMHFDSDRAESAVRVGLSHLVKKEELDAFIACLKGIIEQYG